MECLITRLNGVVDNPNLPVFETLQQFTLDAIANGGNKEMTDAQVSALNHYFFKIGAIDNSGIWSKTGIVLLPIIGANKNYHLFNYKVGKYAGNVSSAMVDTNGGLEVSFASPNASNITITSDFSTLDMSSVGVFCSSVKGKTLNVNNAAGALRFIFTFTDTTTARLSFPEISSVHMQIRYQCGVDFYQRVKADYYNNEVKSVLLNVNGVPSADTIDAQFMNGSGEQLEKQSTIISGTYVDTSAKTIQNRNLVVGSGNTFGVVFLFTEALTEAECLTLVSATKELVDAF